MTPSSEEPKNPLFELERYAGWLAKDHVSIAVRADVRALGAAMDAGHDTFELLLTLDRDIERLPGGGIRKMLRKALIQMRSALEPGAPGTGTIDAREGERS